MKNFFYAVFFVLALLSITACEGIKPDPIVQSYTEYRQIRIMSFDPPKHFRIKYQDVMTKEVFYYSSKHCTDLHTFEIGKVYTVKINYTKRRGSETGALFVVQETDGCEIARQL
jgi:hypothetical protein